MIFRSVNPATETVLAEYPADTKDSLARKLRRSRGAAPGWGQAGFDERATYMKSAGNVLRSRCDELAKLMTAEMGKPMVQAEAEIEKSAGACDYFAEAAERMLADDPQSSDASRSYIRYEPLGGVLAIMPWNFPFWQTFRFAAPHLMAGNVGLLKHAPNVQGCAGAIEAIFRDAGFPEGVFVNLRVDTHEVPHLINHPAVAAVTLTGSERAGRSVAGQAGAALKKAVLELGGSDPFIVLGDADVHAVAVEAASARCINNGQSCIAAKRFLVEESVADEFEAAFALAMAAMVVGDPTRRDINIGPLARRDLKVNLTDQVSRSVAAGARVVVGGHDRDIGYYYAPAVLADVKPGMAVFDEETFGPVAAVVRAADEHELIKLANATTFGLGASVWGRDIARAERLGTKLHVGNVFINGRVKSDPRLPFGGIKASGYGRELALPGIREFVNAKTVWVK